MNNWEEKRLGDIMTINPKTVSSKYCGPIQYIDIAAVNQGNLSGYKYYNNLSEAPSRAKRIIKNGDIIFSTVRPNLRAYYYIKNCPNNAVCSTGFAVLQTKIGNNSRFVYELVIKDSFVDYLTMVAKGSAYPAVDTKDFLRAKVHVPNLSTQNKIADILSAYDDLIENNNCRIELLEKAAQNLYKEWFVRFRFPEYKSTKFENGLPKGWSIARLGDCVDIAGGKRLPEEKELCSFPTNHPYIRIRDLDLSKYVALTNDFQYIDESTYNIIKHFTVQTGDVLLSIVGTIGNIACVGESLNGANLTENCVKLIHPKCLTCSYIYHFLNSDIGKGEIQAGIVGATQPKLPIYNIKKIKILKPTIKLVEQFSKHINQFDQQLMILQQKNQNLVKQRDLLLARLMNGKLEV